MRILIAGDYCQIERVDVEIRNRNFDILFQNIKHVLSSVDYSIVNFEFPIVFEGVKPKPIDKCGPNLHGTKESIDALTYVGFSCCTLANNHILDQGAECCIQTKEGLEQNNIDTVGVGKDINESSIVLYKKIGSKTIAIINCAEHEFTIATNTSPGANPLNPIQQYYKIKEARINADYVLVIVHGGHEYYQLPSPRMKETYRFLIDAGADAVVNHHQHCYSGYEIYNGKPIFYGLGNLLFDDCAYRYNTWNEGYMVILDFEAQDVTIELVPYTQCNEIPSVVLLSDKEKLEFNKKILKLNQIISNNKQLENSHIEWMKKNDAIVKILFEPYIGRILTGLYRRNLLPSFIYGSKKLKLKNYLLCESHFDRIKTLFS